MLELPLWMVPPFEEMFARQEWRVRVTEWLARAHGLVMVRTDGHHPADLPEFYVACGQSSRGVGHAVVYRAGALAHDPHPSDEGVAAVEWTWHLEPPKAVAADKWAPVVVADAP